MEYQQSTKKDSNHEAECRICSSIGEQYDTSKLVPRTWILGRFVGNGSSLQSEH